MTWRVVLVDDDDRFRSLTAALLETDPRFEVSDVAADGGDAPTVVANVQPGVVLLDLEMPLVGGLEALPALNRA